MELGPRNVTIAPGTTALIEIAIDHLNRIVTPFANPVVRTVSAASTSVDGHVVYVATSTEEPVSLYIGDGQSNDLALSLTLAPRFVPPREIRLTVPGYRGTGASRVAPDSGKSASMPVAARGGQRQLPLRGLHRPTCCAPWPSGACRPASRSRAAVRKRTAPRGSRSPRPN